MNILERAKSIRERAKGIRERAKSIAQSIGKRAKRTLSHYAFTEGHNPDPASYAVQTLNDIIHDNTHHDWHHIYTGAMAGFIRIFKCFNGFNYGHIEGLHMNSGNLGDLLMHYCGHNNLFRRNWDELPVLVATGHDIVAKLLQDTQFQQFCKNINPFNYNYRGELQIDYSKRDFKAALFMHDDLASFMNALFGGFVGGAHKRTARVPRKQRKQRKSRKQRK